MIVAVLLKMLASSGILMGYYWLFLRNKRFHHYNRFFLLTVTSLAIILPFVRIPVFIEPKTSGPLVSRSIEIISATRWEDDFMQGATDTRLPSWISLQNAALLIYGGVIIFLVVVLLRSLRYIRTLSKKYSFQRLDRLRLYDTSEPGTPFSFFRSIFWNDRLDIHSEQGQQIFRHELFHVRQKHSADVIFLELVCIVFWINPIFHLIKKEIKAIHEFLADQHAIQQDNRNDYAELLVLQSILAKQSSLSNCFFQNHIKRRIAMITQFKSKKYSYWTRLMALPLSLCLFCVIALYAKTPGKPPTIPTLHKSLENIIAVPLTVLIDAGHGGEDAGATTANGFREKDFCLAIAQAVKQQASGYNLKIVMTREEDVFPTLRQRTELAANVNADLIISLHVGSSQQGSDENGFDIYITNRNEQTLSKSKVLGADISDQLKSLYTVGPLRQRKEKGIWILDSAPCPAVLIECGYLTSENDLKFISNAENQRKIARNILDGIARYQSRGNISYEADNSSEVIFFTDTVKPRDRKAREKAQRKEAEAKLRELEAKHKALEQKYRDMEESHKKMAEAKMAELEQQQKALEQKQRDMEETHEKMAEARKVDVEANRKAVEEKRQRMDEERMKMMELRAREHELELKAQAQKRNEMELARKQVKEDRLAEMQIQQKALAAKRRELEVMHKKMIENNQKELQLQQQVFRQKLQEMERATRKMAQLKQQEDKAQEKEMKQKQVELGKRKKEDAQKRANEKREQQKKQNKTKPLKRDSSEEKNIQQEKQ